VTGASGGLGQAIARGLAERGARVALSARRIDVLEELATEIGASVIACDLTDAVSTRELVEQASGVDLLVANAGLDSAEDLVEQSDEHIARVVAVNLTAPAVLAAGIARAMTSRREGHIVFVSSMAGKFATAGNGPLYTATKWGLRGLGLGLREELRTTGVGVSTVFPGPIRDSGMFADSGAPLPASIKTNSPREVAGAVVRAVERNRAEIDVAAPLIRFGGLLGGPLPRLVAGISRRQGVGEVRAQMAAARRR